MANGNPLKEAWAEGRAVFGLWVGIPNSFVAELLAGTDVDYVCVDQQHGLIGYEAVVPMFQAIGNAGSTPITRVLSNDPYRIMESLDAGAWGVIVPLVNSPEEAARAVAACRYPPRGMRSYGPIRASGVIGSTDPEDLDREALCLVMVETKEALERVEEISATPGMDGIYIGPSDLAISLGLSPTLSIQEGEHAEAIKRIRESCKEHGIAACIHSPDGEWARKHAEDGFDMVTVASDAAMLRVSALREVSMARGERTEADPGQGYS
ncbi:MAG: HpcH/HpaI aldolase family protein [Rubrobacteraceae bacterium]